MPRIVQHVGCLSAIVLAFVASASGEVSPIVEPNQNHARAGVLRNGVLTVLLEIAQGEWHPESDAGAGVPVYAFGEAGRPLQNPGPLIRVPQGTQVRASIHNTLGVPVAVCGLADHASATESKITIVAGATEQVVFQASTAGVYFYWGATKAGDLRSRSGADSQLNGALVVDPPGTTTADEVFVVSIYQKGPVADPTEFAATINGKSWPYTPHLEYALGSQVRWKWINASAELHALHLHGFYFRVDADYTSGGAEQYVGEDRPRAVTQRIEPAESFAMSWTPERPGRWLFHCHMVAHMIPATLPKTPEIKPAAMKTGEHEAMNDSAGMGQLVIGVTIPAPAAGPNLPTWHPERKLQLVIHDREGGAPLYAIDVVDPDMPKPAKAGLLGPPIVLTRGQPVEIEVVNHLKQPTAIHWHGIELESYYDGVPGWTGNATEITPPIAPGSSFVARMAPPRAGTFIYHTHWHDEAQLTNGIYGPLIVLPPDKKFDPKSDLIFVFGMGMFKPFGPMALINGRPQWTPMRLETEKKYRLRLINIAPNNVAMSVSLRDPHGPVNWTIVAKDGADLNAKAMKPSLADLPITVGETYDVEFASAKEQDLVLDFYLPGPKIHTVQTLAFAAAKVQ